MNDILEVIRQGPEKVSTSDASVVVYTCLHEGGEGMLPHGIGICKLTNNEYHPYVVWTIIYDDDRDKWFAESGNYCEDINEAMSHYVRRGGK